MNITLKDNNVKDDSKREKTEQNGFHSTDRCLTSGDVVVDVVGDLTSGPRTVVARESLEKVVFLYLLKGQMEVTLSDVGDLVLRRDEILIIFPGRELTIKLLESSNRVMTVVLGGPGAVSAALRLGFWDLMRATERYEGNFMTEIIERFHAAPNRGRDERVLSLVEHLLTTVWSRVRYSSGQGEFFDAVRTLNGMVTHGEIPTTEAAAAALGISRSKLNKLFLAGVGIRPGEYISRTLTTFVQAVLFWTKRPVAQISRDFGFSSSSAFAAFLSRRIGKTPSEFRKQPFRL